MSGSEAFPGEDGWEVAGLGMSHSLKEGPMEDDTILTKRTPDLPARTLVKKVRREDREEVGPGRGSYPPYLRREG